MLHIILVHLFFFEILKDLCKYLYNAFKKKDEFLMQHLGGREIYIKIFKDLHEI